MTQSPLDPILDELWERRADLSPADEDARKVVVAAVDALDAGEARVAQVLDDEVVVDERAKRAILLSFKVLDMVEGSNIGGYVGSGSMVDTWATVGSCAQIGKNVHLSGGVGIGGVLEPPQAAPVVVEDDAFIGSRSMVVEGARVRRGAKLGAGAILTASTRVFDAETGEELPRGEAPERAVCVGSTRVKSFAGGEFGMPCLLVLRRLEPGKLALNDSLREHGVAP
jgi:2,3,4,5-tetrahydropyridine-2-carboxylate N-succinyltransferase